PHEKALPDEFLDVAVLHAATLAVVQTDAAHWPDPVPMSAAAFATEPFSDVRHDQSSARLVAERVETVALEERGGVLVLVLGKATGVERSAVRPIKPARYQQRAKAAHELGSIRQCEPLPGGAS